MTTTPTDKGQALPNFEACGMLCRLLTERQDGVRDCTDGATETDLSAILAQLDPETRARVLRESFDDSTWAIISDADDADAQRFLDMSDEEFNAVVVELGGDPERHNRAAQAMGRWARKLGEIHAELTAARAEVERLKAERDIAVADRFDAVIGAREIDGQLLDAATEAARLREHLESAIEFVHANVGAMEAQEMRDAYLKEPDPKEPK